MTLPSWIDKELGSLGRTLGEADKKTYDNAMAELSEFLSLVISDPGQTERWKRDVEHVYGTLESLGVLNASVTRTYLRERLASGLHKLFTIVLTGVS